MLIGETERGNITQKVFYNKCKSIKLIYHTYFLNKDPDWVYCHIVTTVISGITSCSLALTDVDAMSRRQESKWKSLKCKNATKTDADVIEFLRNCSVEVYFKFKLNQTFIST